MGRPADAAVVNGTDAATDASIDADGFTGSGEAGAEDAAPNLAAGGAGGASGAQLVECGGVPCLLQSTATCCTGSVCGLTDPTTSDCVDPLAGFRDAGVALEPIVSDPACGDITYVFFGAAFTLPGCCDVSGVCGGNTMTLPTLSGLPFPALCITPAEGTPLLVSTSGTVRCGRDSGAAPDAGDGSVAVDATSPSPEAASGEASSPVDGKAADALAVTD